MTAKEIVEIPAATESTHVVRRRVFSAGWQAIPALLARLKNEHFTGCVTVHVKEGTVKQVHTEQSEQLNI